MANPLTPRERDVLQGLVEGLTNQEIAARLVLAVSTVKWYNRQIYRKLNVRNAREAVRAANEQGLLDEAAVKDALQLETGLLIGRNEELDQLQTLLNDPNQRLITIAGLGGMGKTTLARTLYHMPLEAFPGGKTFIDLSGEHDSLSFDAALTEAFGLPGMSSVQEEPITSLKQAIGTRPYLMIIDNADRFHHDMLVLPELMRHLPALRILVTARTPLQLSGETVFQLYGLRQTTGDAQQLFVQEAKRAQPRHTPAVDHPAVTHICELVGGLPLGIVLAAGWLRLLPVEEVADELEDQLSILHSPHRDRPDRHQSLDDILRTTWQQLTEKCQQALMGLSLFLGRFQRADMFAVTGGTLTDLRVLVDGGLVRPDKDGYTLHPVVRRFAREHLEGDTARVRLVQQFARYILQQVIDNYERNQPLTGAANVPAAVSLATSEQQYDLLYHALFGLSLYFSAMGNHQIAIALMQDIAAAGSHETSRRAYTMLAWHHLMAGTFDQATKALRCARATENIPPVDVAYMTFFEGLTRVNQGNLDDGRICLEDAADMLPPDDSVLATGVYLSLGLVAALREDLSDAVTHLEQASITCRHRSQRLLIYTYSALVHSLSGEHDKALYHCERGLTNGTSPYRNAAAHLTAMAAFAVTLPELGYDSSDLRAYVKSHRATQVFIPPILDKSNTGKAPQPGPAIAPDTPLTEVLPQLVTLCQKLQPR